MGLVIFAGGIADERTGFSAKMLSGAHDDAGEEMTAKFGSPGVMVGGPMPGMGFWMTTRPAICIAVGLTLLARAGALPKRPVPCKPADLASCTAERMATPLSWPGGYVALDRVLRTLARRAAIPMSVVVAWPVPNVDLPRLTMTPAALLGLIVRTHPTYAWRISGGVLCFNDRRLQNDPQNFLNWRLASFTVGPDVGMDLLVLAQELHRPRRSPSAGMAIEGLRPMIAGAPKRAVLHDVSAQTVLHGLLAAAPTFFSEVAYRSGPPLTRAAAIEALERWRWVPLDEPPMPPPPPPGPPIHVPPKPQQPDPDARITTLRLMAWSARTGFSPGAAITPRARDVQTVPA